MSGAATDWLVVWESIDWITVMLNADNAEFVPHSNHAVVGRPLDVTLPNKVAAVSPTDEGGIVVATGAVPVVAFPPSPPPPLQPIRREATSIMYRNLLKGGSFGGRLRANGTLECIRRYGESEVAKLLGRYIFRLQETEPIRQYGAPIPPCIHSAFGYKYVQQFIRTQTS